MSDCHIIFFVFEQVWDAHTFKCTDTLQGHNNKLMCLQFDESKIISGAQDKTLKVRHLCLVLLFSFTDMIFPRI